MRAEQVAVIGGAHQHRVVGSLGGAALGDRAAHPVDRRVHLGVQPVVQVAVGLCVVTIGALDHPSRAVSGVVGLPERYLRSGFGGQVLVCGRGGRHVRWVQR